MASRAARQGIPPGDTASLPCATAHATRHAAGTTGPGGGGRTRWYVICRPPSQNFRPKNPSFLLCGSDAGLSRNPTGFLPDSYRISSKFLLPSYRVLAFLNGVLNASSLASLSPSVGRCEQVQTLIPWRFLTTVWRFLTGSPRSPRSPRAYSFRCRIPAELRLVLKPDGIVFLWRVV